MTQTVEFQEFPKIARLNRDVIVTEKIDGSNAAVVVTEDGRVLAQSRKRFITPEDDNYGFARWVECNKDELVKLGAGFHYGEWWGVGIQRGYDIFERRFSLFNVGRWSDAAVRPSCCHVVPTLAVQPNFEGFTSLVSRLRLAGSEAAPGFMKPEGLIAWHSASRTYYKVLLENDEGYKGVAA